MLSTANRRLLLRMSLLAVVTTAVALGALAAKEEAQAQECVQNRAVASDGYWVVHYVDTCRGISHFRGFIVDANGNRIPSSAPKPGFFVRTTDSGAQLFRAYYPEQVETITEIVCDETPGGLRHNCRPVTRTTSAPSPAIPVSGVQAPPPVQQDDLFQDLPSDLRDLILRFLPI